MGEKAKVDKKVVDKKDGKKPGAKKQSGPTIASVALEGILAGLDNDEVLAKVKKQFPDSKTGKASINWYRNKAREENPKIPASRDITKARTAKKRAEEKAAKDAEKAKAKAAKAKGGKGKGKDEVAADPTA